MRRTVAVPAFAAVLALVAAAPGASQLVWSSPDAAVKVKLGLLAQLQAEEVDVAPSGETATNLFVRRARLMFQFEFADKVSVFLQTDSPNLGKGNAQGIKDAGDVFIQDLVVAYQATPTLQVEAGMMYPPSSYNHLQSGATLLAVDYGPYTFAESTPIGARLGRDYGVQLRGYAAGDRLEYRAGLFQGARGEDSANSLRYAGRLMVQFFTPQKGLFYRGTSFGKTKTVAIGASYDAQEGYASYGADLFADLPLANGDGLTAQIDFVRFDGGDLLAALAEQDNALVELGYAFAGSHLMPFVQWARQDFAAPAGNDETKTTAGLAWAPAGHQHHLKLALSRIAPRRGDDRDQIVLQWQVFRF